MKFALSSKSPAVKMIIRQWQTKPLQRHLLMPDSRMIPFNKLASVMFTVTRQAVNELYTPSVCPEFQFLT